MTTNNMNTYNKIICVNLREKCEKGCERTEIYLNTPEECFEHIKSNPHACEKISQKQIKPIFDCDVEIDEKESYEFAEKYENVLMKMYLQHIQNQFGDKPILVMHRLPRKVNTRQGEKWKISLRLVVQQTRITPGILKKIFETPPIINIPNFDLSIYNKNGGLYLPFTTKHPDKDKTVKSDREYKMIPINYNDNIFDYCCSYIEESYEDWDTRFTDTKLTYKKVEVDDGVEEETDNNKIHKKINVYISHLSKKRATDYDTWIAMNFCIANICNKHGIKSRKRNELIHQFSELAEDKYVEDEVDKWIDTNLLTVREKGYGWNYLKYTCLKEDDPEYFDKQIGKNYQYVKEQFEKEVSKFMNPVGFMRITESDFEDLNNPFQIVKKADLLTQYQNVYYWDYDSQKDKWAKKKFINTWLDDENIRQYERMVFKPYHLTDALNKKYYNLYKGTRAEKLDILEIDYSIIQPILDHIKKVMMNNNDQYFNWFIEYLAQIIQKPVDKTNVAIVFHGKQGCGKNIFIDFFANGILGTDLALSTANPTKTVFSQFNACIINKILLVCNEIGGEMYGLMDKVKDLITAPSLDTEKKFADRITVDNYINCIMTTNNTNPLNIPLDDRRFVWFECNNSQIGNVEYFQNLADLMNDDKTVATFYHYLKNEVKITITNFQTSRPKTEAYLKIQNLNIPNHIRFIQEYIKDVKFRIYNKKPVYVIKRNDLYSAYSIWCDRNKYTSMKQNTFYHHLETDDNGIQECSQKGNIVYSFDKNKIDEYMNSVGFDLKMKGITELPFVFDDLDVMLDDSDDE